MHDRPQYYTNALLDLFFACCDVDGVDAYKWYDTV